MENIQLYDVKELNNKEIKKINGGFWIGFLIAVLIDIIDNPEDFEAGFNATFAEQQL